MGLSWWIGFALGPIAGTQLLSVSTTLLFGACAFAASTASLSLLALEPQLPEPSRLTPRLVT